MNKFALICICVFSVSQVTCEDQEQKSIFRLDHAVAYFGDTAREVFRNDKDFENLNLLLLWNIELLEPTLMNHNNQVMRMTYYRIDTGDLNKTELTSIQATKYQFSREREVLSLSYKMDDGAYRIGMESVRRRISYHMPIVRPQGGVIDNIQALLEDEANQTVLNPLGDSDAGIIAGLFIERFNLGDKGVAVRHICAVRNRESYLNYASIRRGIHNKFVDTPKSESDNDLPKSDEP